MHGSVHNARMKNLLLEVVLRMRRESGQRRLPIPTNQARGERMLDLHQTGQTLEQIAASFNLSRERVRQILKKRFGISGRHKIAQTRKLVLLRASRAAKKDARFMRLYGCNYSDFGILNDGLPEHQEGSKAAGYFSQMRFANTRIIEWQLTFPEWCAIWEASGHFPDRGRGADSYCMSRFGDSGPYSKDNVRIVTNRQNIQDGYETRRLPLVAVHLRMWKVLSMRERGLSYAEIAKEFPLVKKQTLSVWACDARRWKKEGRLPPQE